MTSTDVTRGRFITLEGGEGAGKSTQAHLLAAALGEWGVETLLTREPGGTKGAEQIRRLLVSGAASRWDPTCEALLHTAARRDHLVRQVWPALERGVWVICDRFADSTLAYQGHAQGLEAQKITDLYHLIAGDFVPDLTLIHDLPVAEGLRRAGQRDGAQSGRYENFDRTFHERLRQGFLDIATGAPERCVVIDAAATPDTVHRAILQAVRQRLKVGPR